ncbi:hypothetical protein PENSPDRAFT_688518 [Peniophora sp. CONT]|nr:hypothetical protein PENSPDRAFT_688518 [Peniophora sp. CONT]
MSQWMSATFFGTSSGGGPSESRNCSSLVLDIVADGSLWMVDCAEGTYRQFTQQWQPPRGGQAPRQLKASKVNHIFITHMHADHVMGLIPFLRNTLGFPHETNAMPGHNRTPKINIYGPAGLRNFIRLNMQLTSTRTADPYIVHELLTPTDTPTPCEPAEVRHSSEASGQDIMCDEQGFWRDIAVGRRSGRDSIIVHAGPIIHREPCLGFVFNEPVPSSDSEHARIPRKLIILGDTSSPAALTPLVQSTPGRLCLLVHEATDCYIPAHVDPQLAAKRSPDTVARVTAELMNHIGARFPAPKNDRTPGQRARAAILREMELQAFNAWYSTAPVVVDAPDMHWQRRPIAAYDFLTVEIPPAPYIAPPLTAQAAHAPAQVL